MGLSVQQTCEHAPRETPSSQQGQARLTLGLESPSPAQLRTWPCGDKERIRHKTLKIARTPEDQGISGKDHTGLETKESLSEAQEGKVAAERGLGSILVKF